MSRLARVSASWGAPGTAGAGRPLLLVHDGVAVLVEELLEQVRELLLVPAEAELRERPPDGQLCGAWGLGLRGNTILLATRPDLCF